MSDGIVIGAECLGRCGNLGFFLLSLDERLGSIAYSDRETSSLDLEGQELPVWRPSKSLLERGAVDENVGHTRAASLDGKAACG